MKNSKINKMYVVSFIFALHFAISAYINSTFLSSFIKDSYVGIIYTVASVLILLLLSKNSSILKNFGNKKTAISLFVTNIVGLLGLLFLDHPFMIAVSFLLFFATNTLILFCIDIFIEHYSKERSVGRTRGLYLTIMNLAWMLSPLLGALLLAEKNNYANIYIASLCGVIISFFGLLLIIRDFKDKSYIKTPINQTFKFLKENPHIRSITIINFILHFFFATMVVYMPIYLHKYMQFSWDQIGLIFTIMLSPFVIFSYPTGILIDKYHIKKRSLLYFGFIVMSISTFSIVFLDNSYIALWAIVLFCTRMGASIIEATSEVYFFSHTKEEESYLLGVYRDMSPIAYIVAPLVSSIIFIFLPFQYIFLILSIITTTGLYFIPKLVHDHE